MAIPITGKLTPTGPFALLDKDAITDDGTAGVAVLKAATAAEAQVALGNHAYVILAAAEPNPAEGGNSLRKLGFGTDGSLWKWNGSAWSAVLAALALLLVSLGTAAELPPYHKNPFTTNSTASSALAYLQSVASASNVTSLASWTIPGAPAGWVTGTGMFVLTNSATALDTNSSVVATTYTNAPAGHWYWLLDSASAEVIVPTTTTVFQADFSALGDTTEPDPGTPQIGPAWFTEGASWGPMTQGHIAGGQFITSGRESPGSIYYLMATFTNPVNIAECRFQFIGTDPDNNKVQLGMAAFTNFTLPDMFLHIRIGRTAAYLDTYRTTGDPPEYLINRASCGYAWLALNTTHTARVYWQPPSTVILEINGVPVVSGSTPDFGVTPTHFFWEQFYNSGAATTNTDALALISCSASYGVIPYAATAPLTNQVLVNPTITGGTATGSQLYTPTEYWGMYNGGYAYGMTNQAGWFYGGYTSQLTNYDAVAYGGRYNLGYAYGMTNQSGVFFGGTADHMTNWSPILNSGLFNLGYAYGMTNQSGVFFGGTADHMTNFTPTLNTGLYNGGYASGMTNQYGTFFDGLALGLTNQNGVMFGGTSDHLTNWYPILNSGLYNGGYASGMTNQYGTFFDGTALGLTNQNGVMFGGTSDHLTNWYPILNSGLYNGGYASGMTNQYGTFFDGTALGLTNQNGVMFGGTSDHLTNWYPILNSGLYNGGYASGMTNQYGTFFDGTALGLTNQNGVMFGGTSDHLTNWYPILNSGLYNGGYASGMTNQYGTLFGGFADGMTNQNGVFWGGTAIDLTNSSPTIEYGEFRGGVATGMTNVNGVYVGGQISGLTNDNPTLNWPLITGGVATDMTNINGVFTGGAATGMTNVNGVYVGGQISGLTNVNGVFTGGAATGMTNNNAVINMAWISPGYSYQMTNDYPKLNYPTANYGTYNYGFTLGATNQNGIFWSGISSGLTDYSGYYHDPTIWDPVLRSAAGYVGGVTNNAFSAARYTGLGSSSLILGGDISSGGVSAAVPSRVSLDSSYGTGAPGKNYKLSLFSATGTGYEPYTIALGVSGGLMEITTGTGMAIAFFQNQTTTPTYLGGFTNGYFTATGDVKATGNLYAGGALMPSAAAINTTSNTVVALTLRVVTGSPATMPTTGLVAGSPVLSNGVYHVYDGSAWVRVSP